MKTRLSALLTLGLLLTTSSAGAQKWNHSMTYKKARFTDLSRSYKFGSIPPLSDQDIKTLCQYAKRTGKPITIHKRVGSQRNWDMRTLGTDKIKISISNSNLSCSNILIGKTGFTSLSMIKTVFDGALLVFEEWPKCSFQRRPDGSVLWKGVSLNLNGSTFNDTTVFPKQWEEGVRTGQSARSRAEEVAIHIFGMKKSTIPSISPPSHDRRPDVPKR